MGYREIELSLPTAYTDEELKKIISGKLRVSDFSFQVVNKSLDARNKRNIP